MNKIGQGYYYTVYELGNDRVLKSQTNHLVRIVKLLKWRGKTLLAKIRSILTYPSQIRYDHRTLLLSVETSTLNPEMFGNPIWVNGFEYEQDKALLLEDYFRDHTFAENKTRFDEYPALLYALWSYGLSDTVFNFTINNGISLKTDKLIYIDFNEFTDSKEKIIDCIKNEKWRTQASLRYMSDSKLKEYILLKMVQEITLQKLDEFWNRQTELDLQDK